MVFMSAEERAQARPFSELAVCNPFVPERVALERCAFGRDFAAIGRGVACPAGAVRRQSQRPPARRARPRPRRGVPGACGSRRRPRRRRRPSGLDRDPPALRHRLPRRGRRDRRRIQVKLLRVLQERSFHRLGDTRARRFAGKIVAATNRHRPAEMQGGRFRPDLYYRLCSDVIENPAARGPAPRRARRARPPSCASSPAASPARRRPRPWPGRRRAESPSTWARTTPGPGTCASSRSACAT